ncbi:MraY family glycosyltransferase [Pseudomonas sp. PDM09]|uniref:MraY family glycosyltransferase n=1 Tax=Pseudomonas sp. PDM09 TaxID=2769270 RepID=UPI00177C0B07|nr:glycosyltransferase family 4 protein [Pseudomonas sp. PDM09]MBD9563427.1 glycosyltransferase family 4 protein [Pseudomonas sp. PDM09]
MSFWWFFLGAGVASFVLTALLRQYALARSLMDIPNARSSHSIATPRGGGVAIVVVFLLGLCLLYQQSMTGLATFLGMAVAGVVVAVIGFMDDHGHIAARWRLAGHFCAAAWMVFWFNAFESVNLFGMTVHLGWSGAVIAAIYLVWMLNLYNFMDGIDGIASVEAMSACAGACLLYALDDQSGLIGAPLLLALAVAGFLIWNFPPARIFMGDAGSGFLGIILGAIALAAANVDFKWFWVWNIMLGVFVVDATFTLLRRLLRGEKVYEAHRSHAYQYASRLYGKHLPVTLGVLLINVFWLLPVAFSVVYFDFDGAAALAIAYVPLLLIAIKYRAGELEHPVHTT